MVKPYSWEAVQHNNACLMPKHPCAYLILAGEVGVVCPDFELPIHVTDGPNDLDILPILQLSHLALLLRFPLQARHWQVACCAFGSDGWHGSQQRGLLPHHQASA